jgi:leucyl-tRNA synthetase
MPQWAGSCWYYLRYTDPLNSDKAWASEKEKYWMPVDLYVGGVEHAVLHLLYSRFWHHVLYDLGLVSTKEPFKKLFNQGMIGGEDGQKMSKSRGNVVNPDEVVEKYGADSFRIYEMFMGPLDKSKPWNTKGLQGCYRFVQKIWRLYTEDESKIVNNKGSKESIMILHQTIKKVTDDLDSLSFNTAVSQMMIFVNHMLNQDTYNEEILHTFLIILNPFAPHLSEELNEMIFKNNYCPISDKSWPNYDGALIVADTMTIAVQINGKTRGTIEVDSGLDKENIFNNIQENEQFIKYLENGNIIKKIYVPNRLVNFVIV